MEYLAEILGGKKHLLKSCMEYLAEILGGKKHLLKSYEGYNVTVNTTKLSPIVQYFHLYPLKTKKYITYFN
jgi:hypothetical protein